jgi:hypothetical protein
LLLTSLEKDKGARYPESRKVVAFLDNYNGGCFQRSIKVVLKHISLAVFIEAEK